MKKLLALVLALVMTLGLATVSSSAAYSDEADVSLNEAVDVMSAVGVFQGADGKFSPKENLNREQAAKLIAYLDLGEDTAEALPAVKVFDDVPATSWSAKYIAYCADAGYIAGDGTGKFNPAGELNGYAFGKMVLCVLGYDADVEGFVGNTWSINVAKLMEKNDIAKGVSSAASATLTREQAAQYCLNALKADMVEYESKGTNVTINGAVIATGASSAKSVVDKTAVAAHQAIANEVSGAVTVTTVQLGEKLYDGDLTYGALGTDTTDDFGRNLVTWQYKNKNVATHNSTAKVVFNAKTSAANVVAALKGYKFNGTELKNKDVLYAGNGDTTWNQTWTRGALTLREDSTGTAGDATNIASAINALTGDGKLVEFYADSNANIVNVVAVSYTVGEITKVSTNSKGDVTYTLKSNTSVNLVDYADADKDDTISFETAPAKGDIVTFVKPGVSTPTYVYPTTSFTGAQTAYNTDAKTITVAGTAYKVGTAVSNGTTTVAVTDFDNSNNADNIYYVDQYGFVVKTTAKSASTDYAYIVDASGKLDTTIDGTTPTITVRAVLADGTVDVYNVAVEKKSGNWYIKGWAAALTVGNVTTFNGEVAALVTTGIYGYTLDGKEMELEKLGTTLSDGSTTLIAQAGSTAANKIDKNDTSVVSGTDTVLLNKDVTIVIYDDDAKAAKVYTGTSSLGTTALASYKTVVSGSGTTKGTAKIVFDTVTYGVTSSSDNFAYINITKGTTFLDGNKTKYRYTATLADGTTMDLTATSALTNGVDNASSIPTYGLYKYTEDGTVSNSDYYTFTTPNTFTGTQKATYGTMHVTDNLMSLGSNTDYYDISSANVVYIDSDLNDLDGNSGWIILKVDNGTVTTTVDTIFVTNS